MKHPPAEDPKSRRTVLDLITEQTGLAPKVFLPDSGSEHGASPIIDPGSANAKHVPQGRDKYQLLGEIARGGMGVIMKGHDTDLGRDVALKVLDKELAKKPAIVQRFVEEAQIGGQLQHPGIVPVYELGLMADDSPFFTMKLVKGRTLAALFLQRKSPAENRGALLAIFESVCQTMAYAHSKGVLHRDLKPANIMVGAFGEVQVVDWGLAKVLRRGGVADEKRAKAEAESFLTVIETVRSGSSSTGSDSIVGSVMGTPAYMAPEQAQGDLDLLDERADVFSLGAILCELLTGRPPYESIKGESTEGETIIMQAARAKLGPARARLESCDADPALKKIAFDCLTPAREARPPNADEVAKAVHAYLTSVEERAQKAELETVEARIKVAEERRARRLTLALAGAVVVAVALGGGGFYWVSHEREQRAAERAERAEQTRAAVEAAYGDSIELGQAKKPEEALVAARRALSLAQAGEADEALLARARAFVATAELAVGAAERERTLAEQDEKLRSRLIDLRIEQTITFGDPKREAAIDAAFAQAFHDYGVDLEAVDVTPALERIRERKIAAEVALALDDWGGLRRKVQGAKSEKAENLFYLALDLDPDPVRKRMREAVAANDRTVMLELCAPENLPKLEPGSVFVLTATLWDRFEADRPILCRTLEQAVRVFPDDYVLQTVAGNFLYDIGRYEAAASCRTAALALRPHDIHTRLRLADSQFFMGRFTDSVKNARIALAMDGSSPEAHYHLGTAQLLLGEYAEALKSLERALELADKPDWYCDLRVAQYMNDVLTRDELVRFAERESNPAFFATYLFPLIDHPDPKRRDPEYVIRVLGERAAMLSGSRWTAWFEAVARVRLEDWPGALAAIENRYKPPQYIVMSPMAYEFLRSLIYSRVGKHDEARACYERGVTAWNDRTADDPAAWERSDAKRWRREAEAVLAK